MTLLKVFMRLLRGVPLSLRLQEELGWQLVRLEHRTAISEVLMVFLMVSFQCSGSSMIQLGMLIRVVVNVRDHLPFILNPGIMIYLISYNSGRIMGRKRMIISENLL